MSNLTFDEGQNRVNVRAVGIIRRDGHVLVVREDDDDFVCLPGGRIQRGESSLDAIHREMNEELNAQIEGPQLKYIIENFFWRYGKKFHEFAFYYEVEPPAHVAFVTQGVCQFGEDDGKALSFEWVPYTANHLCRVNLHPLAMRTRLLTLPDGFEHHTVVDPEY
ncbi:NUDIX domain-containing protein [uncultured Maritalea sp.]|jgi:8-oxo-dGTP pyrophosphatase MutT (NUDIX family)|uniref:NUDIX hydrolase n=1 Tax=uncultured Maritalea sp. TaxID=757249 RepID=UPI0026242301|nr:NUDIX domain-containing protein [uncultured Maritalea sp.]